MATTRDQIIDTTCELMETQGYHGTGLNQILAESGTPKGSLYYYFPEGKEELAADSENLTVVQGDVTDTARVDEAIAGSEAVLSVLSPTSNELVSIAKLHG